MARTELHCVSWIDCENKIVLYFLDWLWGQNYYRPQRSCGQGYVFTRVCDSVNGGGMSEADTPQEQTPPEQTHPPPGSRSPGADPLPVSRLRHTIYERPVRILLECILVLYFLDWFWEQNYTVFLGLIRTELYFISWNISSHFPRIRNQHDMRRRVTDRLARWTLCPSSRDILAFLT